MSKVLHVCLCGPFSDGFSYQDNVLTKYHKKLGHQVFLITSCLSWSHSGEIIKVPKANYLNEDGVNVIRLENLKNGKFAKYKDFLNTIEAIHPDIIFVHGCNFSDLDNVRKYVEKNQTTLYIDNHADETNSATNFLSKHILHGFIWKRKIQKIIPYVRAFYGVLPKRCEFLIKMYSIPKDKVKLLVMGLDDDVLQQKIKPIANVENNIISIGGKIDEFKAKEICRFLDAFISTNHSGFSVVIYGSIIDEYKQKILGFCNDFDEIVYLGWLNHSEIVNLINNSTYCVFPGRHSVLWEEAVCLGKPIVVKYLDGYSHVDIGGNVFYLRDSSVEYYRGVLLKLFDFDFLKEITKRAANEDRHKFLYSRIAKESLE